MRMLAFAAAAAALLATAAQAQPAQTSSSGQVCIDTIHIDHTTFPDSGTILFHMDNHKIWKASLNGHCPGLKFNGFIYEPTPPHHICGNLQTIKVIETGSICTIGPLEQFTPAPKEKPAH